jgi:hypothetical protein
MGKETMGRIALAESLKQEVRRSLEASFPKKGEEITIPGYDGYVVTGEKNDSTGLLFVDTLQLSDGKIAFIYQKLSSKE